MSTTKHTGRLRTLLLSWILSIAVCGFLSWGIRESLFPPTDVCAIEQREGKRLIDISQVYPSENNIELIGHIGGKAESVFVRGHTAFVKLGLELAVFDVRDPATPERIGYILIPGDLIYVDEKGHYAYINSSSDSTGLWKVSVSNPDQMSIIHIYKPPEYNSITSIRLVNEQAYITTRKCEHIYFLEGSINTRCDNTLHIVDTSSSDAVDSCYQGLLGSAINNFAARKTPELITAPQTAYQGDYMYAAEDENGFKIYDVSSPSNRVEIGSYSIANPTSNIFSFGTYLYATSSKDQGINQGVKHTLRMFDVTNPIEPIDLGELATKPIMIATSDNYAFLRNYPSPELEILDMSRPRGEGRSAAPNELLDIGNMTIIGNRAYASTMDSRFLIIDMSDKQHPTIIADQYVGNPEQSIDHISVGGNYAYMIVRDVGIKILDISNETNVFEVGQYNKFYSASELAVKDNYVYAANQFGGFQIIDVSTPQQPIKIGEYNLDHQINKMQVVDNYLLMSAYDSGFQILDISDPRIPSLASSFITGSTILGFDVSCQYIYVTDREYGLFILKSNLVSVRNCIN